MSSGYTGPVTEIFTDLSGSQSGGASLQAAGAWPPDRCRGPAGASAARRHTLGPAQHPLPILPASPPFPPGFNVRVRVTTTFFFHFCSVADSDPGSVAFLTPGSGIGFFRIPDLGSQDHICKSFFDNFFGKKFYNSLKIGQNFFLQHFKAKIIYNFVKFVAT